MSDYIDLPASKSIGARFLAASYFAGTLLQCRQFNDCDDLKVIQKALQDLYISRQNVAAKPTVLDIHASGTAFRFMAAIAASTPSANVILTGTPRLCSRPMTPLLDVLCQAGAHIEALGENGTGPYKINGGVLKGGDFEIRGDVSSQFISALMLAAPTWEGGMRLRFTTPLVSRPYAEMTARVIRDFEIDVELSETGVTVKEGKYVAPANFRVEADWSAAGFIYEAAAFKLSQVWIADLVSPEISMQGDAATAKIYRRLGVKSEFKEDRAEIQRYYDLPDDLELDLTHNPDLVPALILSCAFNTVRFRFTGVRNLRLKESDRLAAMQTELMKFGFPIEVGEDHIEWQGGVWSHNHDFVIETYDDHRIAMAFAISALRKGTVKIANPDVVDKSFANFWEQLPKLGLKCKREGNIMIVKKEDDWLY